MRRRWKNTNSDILEWEVTSWSGTSSMELLNATILKVIIWANTIQLPENVYLPRIRCI
jgi:hypothetical protein